MDKEFFSNKNVLVMGLGKFAGGLDSAEFASKAGAKVIVTDLLPAEKLSDSIGPLESFDNIDLHLGSHQGSDFEQADIIIVNPAVTPDNEFVKIARDHDKIITSQINIFLEICPAATIAITGSNGKSTTAALTAHLLKAGCNQNTCRYRKVWLSGNIGNKPLLMLLDEIHTDDLVVLELSSFQAEQLSWIKKGTDVALLTNLQPNHLDRHHTFENYCRAKENIFSFQKPNANNHCVSFFFTDDKIGSQWFEKYKDQPGRTCFKYSPDDLTEEICEKFNLPGRMNLNNLAAAVAIAHYFGVEDKQINAHLPDFEPLPHRLEFVAEKKSIRWYNDSIATTPASSIAALDAFEQPKIIIAGGYDKKLPFDELGKKIAQKAKAVILLGQTAKKINDAIKKNDKDMDIKIVGSLAEAVETANQIAVKGDIVLLSPACASYDMFDNFQQRGEEFNELVRRLAD